MTALGTPPSSPGLCARMYTPSLYTHHTGLEACGASGPNGPILRAKSDKPLWKQRVQGQH